MLAGFLRKDEQAVALFKGVDAKVDGPGGGLREAFVDRHRLEGVEEVADHPRDPVEDAALEFRAQEIELFPEGVEHRVRGFTAVEHAAVDPRAEAYGKEADGRDRAGHPAVVAGENRGFRRVDIFCS